jgi:hypothetical protein
LAWIKNYEVESGARYRVFWKDPSGKQHAKVFKRKNHARSFQRSLDHALDRGLHGPAPRGAITLSEPWPDFIEAPPAPLAASTKSLYQMRWRGDSDDEFAEPLLNLRKIHPGRVAWR